MYQELPKDTTVKWRQPIEIEDRIDRSPIPGAGDDESEVVEESTGELLVSDDDLISVSCPRLPSARRSGQRSHRSSWPRSSWSWPERPQKSGQTVSDDDDRSPEEKKSHYKRHTP